MLSFAQQQQQQQQQQHSHFHHFSQPPSHQMHAQHAFGHRGGLFDSSSLLQPPPRSLDLSPPPRHHSPDAGWGVHTGEATAPAAASMYGGDGGHANAHWYPRHSMPAAMEQELQRRADAAAAAARERDIEIATAMQQVDDYCRNYIEYLARELRGEAQPATKTQRPQHAAPTAPSSAAAAASGHSGHYGPEGTTLGGFSSDMSTAGAMGGACGLAASVAAILSSDEYSPSVVPPLLVQPHAHASTGATLPASSSSYSHAGDHVGTFNKADGHQKKKKKKNKKKGVKIEADANGESSPALKVEEQQENCEDGFDGEEGADGGDACERDAEDPSASSSCASDDDGDYRPELARKKKGKSRAAAAAGLGAIFSAPLSKSGRPVGRKVKHEESSGEDSDAASDSDEEGGGGRNKRKATKNHAPTIDAKQRKLPLRAVMSLRTFFIGHINHPFPTDAEKRALAAQCSLNFKQVSDWFTNTRKRFWRPYREHLDSVGWGVCACKVGGAAGEKAVKGGTKKKGAKGKAHDDEAEDMDIDADETAGAAPQTHLHSWMQMWN